MQEYIPAGREKLFTNIIIVISIAIPAVVGFLMFSSKPAIEHTINIHALPAFHAILNSITAVLLVLAFIFIRKGKIALHRMTMLTALVCSVLFLVSYLVYHSLAESTTYGGEGILRYIYYFILITHIILAALVVPFVLFTFFRAFTGNFAKHKKIGRYTLPLWLYVAVTGVLVYLMISPYYG